ncbi:hypothetical protein H310_14527 [Aphanomyces invadans]|uniref:RING-type domain-containing protein n=1 Tax=Aphanomyces invadans TaxID=157072 RepID=A0A024T9L6_9STRA|nr:hypothetical protein H310_14527 [Aphanomyces invadans]ETV90738.1 hypothetical protein H310_14527 [Aphanomyces invadans]|eukprot:XP_008880628.1 hypothetical protein H310_14527 [Aphanomyces invadans]
MERKMEKMVQNNVQQLGNRIPKAKRAQTILDMARLQREMKRRVADVEESTDDANDNSARQLEWHTPGVATATPLRSHLPTDISEKHSTLTSGKKRRVIEDDESPMKRRAELENDHDVPQKRRVIDDDEDSSLTPSKDGHTTAGTALPEQNNPSMSNNATLATTSLAEKGIADQKSFESSTPRSMSLDSLQRICTPGYSTLDAPLPMATHPAPNSASTTTTPQRDPSPPLATFCPPVTTLLPDTAPKRNPPPPPGAAPPSPDVVVLTTLPLSSRTAKPEKAKALSALSSSFKSMCFSTEDPVTSIDTTPDGQCIIVAFSNGSVRLFDVNSTCTEERYGYLLGHLDEELNQQMAPSVVRVKVTSDGCYCFVGCRGTSPKTIMAIHLDKFRHEKDNDDDNLLKYFMNDNKSRGFADVSPNASKSCFRRYFFLTGLGLADYRVWKFDEQADGADPAWTHLYKFGSSSNTALHAYFFSVTETTVGFAGVGSDSNLKIITFHADVPAGDAAPSSKDSSVKQIIPNTKDISYIKGNFAYGYSLAGRFYRLCLANPQSHRDTFDLVVDAARRGGSRSIGFVDHIYATDDGTHVIAIADQVVYYCATDGASNTGNYLMHMIGSSIPSQLVPKYGIPAAIYVPNHVGNVHEPMLLLTTNAEEERDGFFTMDSVRKLQRQLVRGKPSSGLSCWVCGSHSSLHWGTQAAKPTPAIAPSPPVSKPKAIVDKLKPVKEKASTNASSTSNHHTPPQTDANGAVPAMINNNATAAARFEILELRENVKSLEAELAKAQKRVTQVKNEADRRLRAELQLRRSWKKQQLEFEDQLATANTTVDNLTVQNAALTEQHKAMEARLAHETVRQEQEAGVRLQYDQLCCLVRDKLTRVDDHQKILEQTTKSMLQLFQRNTIALKNDGAETTVMETTSDCVICRDRPANTAVYPCGHLCFCEEDGEKYKSHLRHQKQCPVCQVEMVSLLRIFAP